MLFWSEDGEVDAGERHANLVECVVDLDGEAARQRLPRDGERYVVATKAFDPCFERDGLDDVADDDLTGDSARLGIHLHAEAAGKQDTREADYGSDATRLEGKARVGEHDDQLGTRHLESNRPGPAVVTDEYVDVDGRKEQLGLVVRRPQHGVGAGKGGALDGEVAGECRQLRHVEREAAAHPGRARLHLQRCRVAAEVEAAVDIEAGGIDLHLERAAERHVRQPEELDRPAEAECEGAIRAQQHGERSLIHAEPETLIGGAEEEVDVGARDEDLAGGSVAAEEQRAREGTNGRLEGQRVAQQLQHVALTGTERHGHDPARGRYIVAEVIGQGGVDAQRYVAVERQTFKTLERRRAGGDCREGAVLEAHEPQARLADG